MRLCPTQVYVTSLSPKQLLTHLSDHVCLGNIFSVLKRLASDLPLAGYAWDDGFAVRRNHVPNQFHVWTKIKWDGTRSTIIIHLGPRVLVMPLFVVSSIYLWIHFVLTPAATSVDHDGLAAASWILVFWVVAQGLFCLADWHSGCVTIDMVGQVIQRIAKEEKATCHRVPRLTVADGPDRQANGPHGSARNRPSE